MLPNKCQGIGEARHGLTGPESPSNYNYAIYLHDQVTGTNTVGSRGAAEPFGNSFLPRISSDGGWVAFLSDAINLVAGDAINLVAGQTDLPFTTDVFLWSREVSCSSAWPGTRFVRPKYPDDDSASSLQRISGSLYRHPL